MTTLYAQDYFGWTQAQADALRRRSANELDWDNLLEEIEALGQAAENELFNRLTVLLAHLLKWRLQPTRRSRSWVLTIREQRQRIERLLKKNPSLKPKIEVLVSEAHPSAVNAAAAETGLPDDAFPSTSPYDFNQAMTEVVEWEQA
ncbi:MAG: DUF29 domain-containing protein [Caulobacteraceae bacterium]